MLRTTEDIETDGLLFNPGMDIDIQDLNCKDEHIIKSVLAQVISWLKTRVEEHLRAPPERQLGISAGPYSFNPDLPSEQDQLGARVIVKQLKLLIDGWFTRSPEEAPKQGIQTWFDPHPNWDLFVMVLLGIVTVVLTIFGVRELFLATNFTWNHYLFATLLGPFILYLWITTKLFDTGQEGNGKGQDTVQQSTKLLLRGHWGQGKSSILRMLETILVNETHAPPLVINFNAWYRQQDPPIWWQLPRQVYQQSAAKLPSVLQRWLLKLYHIIWMTKFTIGGVKPFFAKMVVIVLLAVSALCLVFVAKHYMSDIAQPANETTVSKASQADQQTFQSTALCALHTNEQQSCSKNSSDLSSGKLFVTLFGSLIATVVSLVFLTRREWLEGSNENSRLANVGDGPVSLAKAYFTGLIQRLNRPVVIIIDDLDRVNEKDAVEFLQVLHTVFDTDRHLLYLVAADRRWLERAYCRYYKFDEDCIDTSGRDLASKFMEKLFHVEVPIPRFNSVAMQHYLESLLDPERPTADNASTPTATTTQSATPGSDTELDAILRKASELRDMEAVERFAQSTLGMNYSREDIAMVLASAMSQPQFKTFLIRRLATLLVGVVYNPRQMKRIINNYSLLWPINWGMQLGLTSDQVLSWCILETIVPDAARQLRLDNIRWAPEPDSSDEPEKWSKDQLIAEIKRKIPKENTAALELLENMKELKDAAEIFG